MKSKKDRQKVAKKPKPILRCAGLDWRDEAIKANTALAIVIKERDDIKIILNAWRALYRCSVEVIKVMEEENESAH